MCVGCAALVHVEGGPGIESCLDPPRHTQWIDPKIPAFWSTNCTPSCCSQKHALPLW